MDAAIVLRDITKTFGETTAVRNLNLEIPSGSLCGFIGPNGAGKTTTIRLIMSILFPDSGEISVLGHASALKAKDRIGYLPEERGVYRKMRVGAFLHFMAGLKGVSGPEVEKKLENSLERVGLGGTGGKRCEELSKGMLQKMQFLAAIIHKPDLLILDEPFTGLDPVSTRLIRDMVLEEHQRGATILFSTHVMAQAEEMCHHIVMLHQGRKVLDESVASIHGHYDPRTIEFEPVDSHADISPLAHLPGILRVDRNDLGYKILLADGTDPARAMHQIIDAVRPARLELARPRLEDVFISLVSGEREDRQALRAGLSDTIGEERL